MSFPLSMMMKGQQSISGDAFNWSSPGYPSGILEPSFIQSPNGYISTLGKIKLTFGPQSALDDILIMVKQTDVVTQDIIGGVYYYTMPLSGILFLPTSGSMQFGPDIYISKQLTDGIHTRNWTSVNSNNTTGSDLINDGFNVKTFSLGINVSELNSLGFISGNICYFKFYHIVGGSGLVNIDTFN